MRVCVIGTRGFPKIEGGVEKHCEILYPLIADQQDAEIIVFRRKPYVNSDIVYDNIRFIDLPSTKIKGIEAVIHSFLSTLYAIVLKADMVHVHNIGPALFTPILKLFGIPVVLTYHSPNYEHKKWGNFARSLLLFSEKIALKFSDKIVFVNKFQMQKYSKEVKDKSVYIPNGIKQPYVTSKTEYLDKYGIQSKKYILSVGRITPEKGFDVLIKAFKEAKLPDYKLVIAGGVEFESKYMEQLKELSKDGSVIFTGYVHGEELAQLYTNAALYVLASYNEGFPLVLLEAMSYNLDVLVSDIPATHLVSLNEKDYFVKGDHFMLAKRLTIKLQNVKERQYDLAEYDWNEIADEVYHLWKEVL